MTKAIRSITHTLMTVAVLWVVDALSLGLAARLAVKANGQRSGNRLDPGTCIAQTSE